MSTPHPSNFCGGNFQEGSFYDKLTRISNVVDRIIRERDDALKKVKELEEENKKLKEMFKEKEQFL